MSGGLMQLISFNHKQDSMLNFIYEMESTNKVIDDMYIFDDRSYRIFGNINGYIDNINYDSIHAHPGCPLDDSPLEIYFNKGLENRNLKLYFQTDILSLKIAIQSSKKYVAIDQRSKLPDDIYNIIKIFLDTKEKMYYYGFTYNVVYYNGHFIEYEEFPIHGNYATITEVIGLPVKLSSTGIKNCIKYLSKMFKGIKYEGEYYKYKQNYFFEYNAELLMKEDECRKNCGSIYKQCIHDVQTEYGTRICKQCIYYEPLFRITKDKIKIQRKNKYSKRKKNIYLKY